MQGRACGNRRSRLAALLAAVGLAALTAHAGPVASPAAVSEVLAWDAPEGCPDGAALQQGLKEALGEPLDFGRLERVRGSIERRAGGWALTLELIEHGRSRTRLITAHVCADLVAAAVLAIQLARVEDGTPAPAAPPSPPPVALPAPTPQPASVEPGDTPPPAAQRAGSAGVHASIVAGAALDLSALSRPAPGLSVAARLTLARVELELYGVALAPVHEAVRAGESVRFTLLAAGPRACYRALSTGSFVARPCVAFELGRFAADGSDLSSAERSFEQWWLAPNAGLALELAANHWLAFEGRAELSRPLLRRTYAVNGSEVVYEPPTVGGRLSLGVSVQIP